MAGLNYIKGYEDGGDVKAEVPVEKEPATSPLTAQAAQSKSPYALPTPKGMIGVDPALLENMQQLINERESRKNSFNEAMRDATAWWSGGMAGPGEALARRAAEREGFDATTFGMKRDLAANKIAQQREIGLGNRIFGGQPAAPMGAQQTGAQPAAAVNAQPNSLIDLVRDPALKETIKEIGQSRGNEAALTEINKYVAENAKDPVLAKNINYLRNSGLVNENLLPSVALLNVAGTGAFVPHTVNTPGGKMQNTPISAAGALAPTGGGTLTPVAPAAAAPTTPTVTTGATAPAVANKPALPHTQPLPKIEPPTTTPLIPTTTSTTQPLVPSNIQTGFTPGSDEDLAAKAEIAKQNIGLQTKQQEPIAKAAGESAVALTKSASTAKTNIRQYDMAEAILRQYPKAFGISQDGSVTAMLSQLVAPGVTVPIVGTLKAPGLEEARAQKLGPKALAARSEFDTLSSRFATEYANQNLTGEGRGTLSNADMKMAGVAKGLSVSSPAAANLVFAVLNRENEQKILDRNNAWVAYQAEARKNGTTPDFNRFRESDAYAKAESDEEARVKRRFPEFFANEGSKEPSKSGTKTAKDFFNK
jgi:hypothetical protein